jgi:hypothetical protein
MTECCWAFGCQLLLLYLYSAAVPGWTIFKFQHIAKPPDVKVYFAFAPTEDQ